MEVKKNHIAVITENGKCVAIARCKLVDDKELSRLLNEVNEHKQEVEEEKEALLNKISDLENEVNTLHTEIKYLKGE